MAYISAMYTIFPARPGLLAAALFTLPAVTAAQQRVVVPTPDGVMRYSADTIWWERDTTVIRRTIFRGDTIEQASLIDGRIRFATTYVRQGDSVRVVSHVDPAGFGPPVAVGLVQLIADRDHLATVISSAETRARTAALLSRPDTRPLPPARPAAYAVSATLTLVQHLDTVRYLRASEGRVDTTVYVFLGDTTVRRIAPAPRTFGHTMSVTIASEVAAAARGSTPPATGVGSILPAAKPVAAPTRTGPVYRARGDTVWFERDTTARMTIYRADTITQVSLLDGRLQTLQVWVVRGDSAASIAFIDSTGGAVERKSIGSPSLYMATTQLASALQAAVPRQQGIVITAPSGGSRAPSSPPEPITYCVQPGLKIIHQGDTARYVRSGAGGPDTSVFVFAADTIVRRISPAPRVFGLTMANTIRGDMEMAIVRRSTEERIAPIIGRLPGAHLSRPLCSGN